MFVFQLMGGLGNQMFQYAAAKSLSMRRGEAFKIDFDDPYIYVKRKFNLNVFNLQVIHADNIELKRLKPKTKIEKRIWLLLGKNPDNKLFKEKKDFIFDSSLFSCPSESYIRGFWQSEKYFEDISDAIRKDFTFKFPLTNVNLDYAEQIKNCNAVSLHVRRGDYVAIKHTNETHGVCSIDYYLTAIKIINTKINEPTFFIFSDDIDWVEQNLQVPSNSVFVQGNNNGRSHEDMRLMSYCKHHIIANSSFSWWGAWLNERKDKIVIAPSQWTTNVHVSATDLLPSSWITI